MAVTLGTTATTANNLGGTALTFACTTVSADTRLLVLVGKSVAASPPTGVTYNGVALTSDGNAQGGFNLSVWHLDNPPAGTFNVVVTIPAGTTTGLIAIPLRGTDSTRAPVLGTLSTASSTSASCSVTGATANDLQIAQCMAHGATFTSAGAPQAVVPASPTIPLLNINGLYSFSVDYITPGSAGNFAWTVTSGSWLAQGVTIYGSSTQQILLDDPLHTTTSDQLLVGAAYDDGTGDKYRDGGVKLKQWAADVNTMFALVFPTTLILGDVSRTLVQADPDFIYCNATLTANRTLTLPNTGLLDGQIIRVVRWATTPGAFTYTISDPLGGRSAIIAASTKGFSQWRAVGTGEWLCFANGVLP